MDRLQAGRIRRQPVAGEVEETLGQRTQRLVDLFLQTVADALLVGRAFSQHQIEPGRRARRGAAGNKRLAAKEEPEILEGGDIAGLDQRRQVYLVVDVELLGGVFVVKLPKPAVGQHTPGQPTVADVEVDLQSRVLV